MNPIVKNILAVVLGIVVGSAVNMGIIGISSTVIPLPKGINPDDMNSITANFHLYKPKHFIFPFLAHALGTLSGAFTVAKMAYSNKKLFALIIGGWFLLGGITMVILLPKTPLWFILIDLGLAYLPMGWMGWKLNSRQNYLKSV
jgi:hypothetical protein